MRRGGELRQQTREQQRRARDIEKLEGRIEALEARIAALHEDMGAPAFYGQSEADQVAVFDELKAREAELAILYSQWEDLES